MLNRAVHTVQDPAAIKGYRKDSCSDVFPEGKASCFAKVRCHPHSRISGRMSSTRIPM